MGRSFLEHLLFDLMVQELILWMTSEEIDNLQLFWMYGFNPFAPSNRQSSLAAAYKSHEKEMKRAYRERIRVVKHGSFCMPLYFRFDVCVLPV